MASHNDLVGYPNNATATAAAHRTQAETNGQSPYRVWRCAICSQWHAGPWTSHLHDPELASAQLAPAS